MTLEPVTTHRHSSSDALKRLEGRSPRTLLLWLGVVALPLAALLWAYWAVIVPLFKDWRRSQEYSIGQLVPLAALYLLWHERHNLRKCRIAPCWWGIGLILLGQAGRAFGLLFLYESAERYSIVLTVSGVVLLLAGRQVFWRVRWILAFLFLMVPLPGRIHNLISGPLQTWATIGAVFLLETFGVDVIREGNTIVVNGKFPLAVAEACNGLRMLTAFVVVAAVLAYILNRPGRQKAALVISSIPIGIGCNIARLCVTAVLYVVAGSEMAQRFFHDFAGLSMMPLAVLILAGELVLMRKLFIPEKAASAEPLRKRSTSGKTQTQGKRRRRPSGPRG